MEQGDRYHTISWDAKEVERQSAVEHTPSRPAAAPNAAAPGRKASEQPEASRQAQAAQPRPKKKKKRRMNPVLALVLWIVIVAVSSMVLASVGWSLARDFAALNSQPKSNVTFTVDEAWMSGTKTVENDDGTTEEINVCDMEKVADALHEAGLVEYPWFFRLFCWVYKADEKVAEGTYTLNTEMDYMALIRGMRSVGGSAVTVDVSIPEGYTVQQIINLLAENGVGSVEELTDTAANYDFDGYDFLPGGTGDISRLEGYLFPDTYNFYVGGRTYLAFQSMLNNFQAKVADNEDLTELFANSQFEMSDIITIASLIEKETDGTDRDKISSVIYNRLYNAGETNYLLQIDAALVYAAGRPITQTDYTELDSPYNLYQHTGLPPTPIANPGIASIKAALQPADTNYYFYALGEDNKHIFSETLAEHNALTGQG